MDKIKGQLCYVAVDYEIELEASNRSKEVIRYELSDGQYVSIGEERFKCPEVIFQPTIQGSVAPNIVETISSSIYRCTWNTTLYFTILLLLIIVLSKRVLELPGIKANIDSMPLPRCLLFRWIYFSYS